LVDPEIAAEIADLDPLQSGYNQVLTVTQVMGNKNMSFRIICSVFHLTKGMLSQTYKTSYQ
jgi:hypothetical protein